MSECDNHGHYANFGTCPECWKQEHRDDADADIADLQAECQKAKADLASMAELCSQARVEIDEHWSAHTDKDGYGPTSLMQRLENAADGKVFDHAYYIERVGIAEKERDQARAERDAAVKERDQNAVHLEYWIKRGTRLEIVADASDIEMMNTFAKLEDANGALALDRIKAEAARDRAVAEVQRLREAIAKLDRYDMEDTSTNGYEADMNMVKQAPYLGVDYGDWVKWDDLQAALSPTSTATGRGEAT